MHNNYYFLRHLSTALHRKAEGHQLMEAFSQNKNELILGFTNGTAGFYIKAYLDPAFCCLSFPADFSRARKNSVNLFNALLHKKVLKVYQFENERCFSIEFEDDLHLLFKMHGNRSNIILYKNQEIEEVFKSSLKKDFELKIETLDRPIDQSYEAFINHNFDYKKIFPTFGKLIKSYLQEKEIQNKNPEDQWKLLQDTLQKLSSPPFYITEHEGQLHLSLLEIGEIKEKLTDPIPAIDIFYIRYISETSLKSLKNQALAEVNKQLKQSENYIEKADKKLNEIETQQSYSILADILMANLHRIPAKATEVTLENFYDNNSPITIKLKQELSPQKNAEGFYRKSKNQSLEIKSLKNNLTEKQAVVEVLRKKKQAIEQTEDFRSLKDLLKKDETGSTSKQKDLRPFHSFSHGGFDIWVGKNAKSNDKMLQQYAYKEDLWLHAKDVSGSHVLIKHQAGKNFPKNVIEKAAGLAAGHSKRKSDTLCPVIVTPRKYVRKRKGDPPGAVVVDKELEVILVVPEKD